MKKYIRNAVVCVVIVFIAAVFAYSAIRYDGLKDSLTTLVETVAPTTTAFTTVTQPTSAAPTTTQAPTTEAEPIIDLDSLTIIDLYPLSLAGGGWDVKHCQGITVDRENGYVYYSYTSLLVKCDFSGNIVGSVSGIDGHLGDITFNEKDGKVYCGYYSEGRTGFYIVIFDVSKITKMDMKPTKKLVRTVYINEAYSDYLSSVTFEGKEEGEEDETFKHKYGCSGIDGVTFGPDFSEKIKGTELLTVAYGIYFDEQRSDNNYQVLLQYDVTSWWDSIAQPYSSNTSHRVGPSGFNGKYFVYTGNTYYGVQTMEYFDELNLWILSCYRGRKDDFPPYSLFAIDADVAPKKKKLKGQPKKDTQYVLSLYQDGEYDKKTGIYGWDSTYGVQGIAYMGSGLFYIVRPYQSWTGKKTAICYLNVWAPEKNDPFTLAAGIGNDYSIFKKPRIKTTAANSTEQRKTD